jgi:hypothetical protein
VSESAVSVRVELNKVKQPETFILALDFFASYFLV